MNASLQLAMSMGPAHRNQYLFSDHYLANLLPGDPRWDEARPEAETFLAGLQTLYSQEQDQLAAYNESQLEEHWFKPILSQLKHVFEPQASVPGLDKDIKRPDYVFFPTTATRQAAASAQKSSDYTAQALAVGEVKQWDTPLGKKQKGGGASFDAQNPSFQIDYYLRATGLKWGILSNGRLWRLVHVDSSQRLSIYYEVDLVDLLSRSDASAMRYFLLFFRQAAFQPDPQGRRFLADALAASHAYAVALEEDLKGNVYQALEKLMQGFLDLKSNGLGEADLREIYENSLYLLYRLLFILYGESRGLLPMGKRDYREFYSLDHLKREFARLTRSPAPMTQKYWGDVQQLFQIINGDNADLNKHLGVPRYNGRLFAPDLHSFLTEKAVGDRALVEAVNLLSLRQQEFVDYRTLGVRQLGSIYEGLLEYQPRYATEPVAAIRESKRKGERWVKAAAVPQKAAIIDRRQPGQVYLETDRGERKATGSYYTPQYIVEYIVKNTLAPLVEQARERVKARAKQARGKAARAQAEQSLIDEILDLKVLDPAMGSAHFLVEATEFLALALATDPYVETETLTEEDLTHWRRRVVERCIYGVDKNPLAVELAKLSLWLATASADKPLSFIDHHLKCGDALVGARVADLGEAPPVLLSKKARQQREKLAKLGARQANLFEQRLSEKLPVVMGKILEITEVESDSYDTVQAKEAADQAVQQLKAPFEVAANLWTSAYFGHSFSLSDYDTALELLSRPAALLAQPAIVEAQAIARGRRRNFFHWELAFPEIFYDRHGQPLRKKAGFDAVVGNPPYVSSRNEDFYRAAKSFIDTRYEVVFYQVDLYYLFTECATHLINTDGQWSFIIPDTWVASVKSKTYRKWITHNNNILQIALPRAKVFDADVDCLIAVCSQKQPNEREIATEIYKISVQTLNLEEKVLLPTDGEEFPLSGHSKLLSKIMWMSLPLKDNCTTGRGIGAYHHSKHSQEIIKSRAFHASFKKDDTFLPELGGNNIGRYEINWGEDRWISYGDWLSEPRDPILFDGERVLCRKILADKLCCTFVDSDWLVDQQVYVAAQFRNSYRASFAMALLGSSLMGFYASKKFHEEGLFPHLRVEQFRQLPIRRISFTTPTADRQQLLAQAQTHYSNSNTEALLAFTQARLEAQPEQADVIHDLLAYLAGQMIEMNKQKQSLLDDFWTDLEGVIDEDAVFKKLHPKGKQEATLWKKSQALQPFVNQNSRTSRTLDEALAWNEKAFKAFVKALAGSISGLSKLVKVYQVYSPRYHDLVTRLAATDRLIDQIVYQLYGLRGEEIEIVEGTNK